MKAVQGIRGFIAGAPELAYSSDGEPRLYVRIGINHYQKRPSGEYVPLAPTFHHLVQFGRGAELSKERFIEGDDFIAVGYVTTYPRTVDGTTRDEEKFVAFRLSHDPNTTTYEIQRRPRAVHGEHDRDATATVARTSTRSSAPVAASSAPPASSAADAVNP